MHDFSIWSLNLGRWNGVRVRLHAFFLLFAVGTIYLSTRDGNGNLIWIGALGMLILFVSVLLHEMGHCYAARRLGGRAEEIVIGPFGGLAPVSVPHEPQHELLTALAGPTVNFAIWLLIAPLLLWLSDDSLLGLLNPIAPQNLVEGTTGLEIALKLAFWLNGVLVVVNLLPAFPFDGGRILRSILWRAVGYREAAVWVGRTAKLAALAFCLIAWWSYVREPDAAEVEAASVPSWVPLLLMAIFLFFSANHDVANLDRADRDDEFFGYDFSQGYTSLHRDEEPAEDHQLGLLERWRERRRETKEHARLEREQTEERSVDDILARLHTGGMEGLSNEDRKILHRVSARFRNRQDS